ncbi:MAG: RNA 2',3'-cyclic phosphodiesterase [Oscillospiraceae bacterium]|nr:RNA 2',3'-cyclic phosphodiesterase [Oscillospiraceae bacterium]
MRLFIAVKLSPELVDELVKTQIRMRCSGVKANYTRPENMHITLSFIGESDAEQAKNIENAFKNTSFNEFSLSLKGNGCFGSIYWIGTESGGELEKLALKIRSLLLTAKIPFDDKKFVSHITLSRETYFPIKCKDISSFTLNDNTSMKVNSFFLMKSERVNGKLIYNSIYEFKTGKI